MRGQVPLASTRFMLQKAEGRGRTSQRRAQRAGPMRRRDGDEQEIGDPKSVKEISRSGLLFSVVFPQVQEVEDVCVPGLEVDAEKREEEKRSASARRRPSER